MTTTAIRPRDATAIPDGLPTPVPDATTLFHLTLYVKDIDRAVAFYRVLFGREPFKHYDDYAEFVLSDPALALSMYAAKQVPAGPISHAGMGFSDPAQVEALRDRLERAGLAPRRQETACCPAEPTKLWVNDPDGNLLEVYVLGRDPMTTGFEHTPIAGPAEQTAGSSWVHKMEGLPRTIPHADCSLDEVHLAGTFNEGYARADLVAFLAEVRRVLKPGGSVVAQGLVCDKTFPGIPDFPGLSGHIEVVPIEHEPMDRLTEAGFVGVFFEQLGDIICFKVEGVQLRKMRLRGTNPAPSGTGAFAVCYRGPFDWVELDEGPVLRRGETVNVPEALWRLLKAGPAASQLTFYADKYLPV
jgi:catechol 2,3-dioxygenase-like lactoylglutathione lyase family enzyme